MLYQTQSEINAFYVGVIQRVAESSRIAIQDADMKSTMELRQEIQMVSPSVSGALDAFLKAYQAWYDVHVGIDQAGTAGNLTSQQNQQLSEAITARDTTRKALLQAL
ncbi:MAG: hypothetical protein HY849_02315 [Nitrosomonadales bacterium]|nr:hypothetical protein [Nitrosomonadales bacterium]